MTSVSSVISAVIVSFVVVVFVSCSVCEAESARSNDQKLLFYVFGSEAIYIIDPESKTVLSKIEADGVCTKSNNQYSRNKCSFGYAVLVRDELIFFSDMPGNRVHVIDVQKGKVIETIPTEGYPYDLYYLHWLKEVWVNTWTNSTFDVINTVGKLERTHKAIKAHIKPGWTHGFMYADSEVKDGEVGYVTHLYNPGVHQLDLSSKSYKGFVNVSNHGCTGTLNLAYSSVNKHAFVQCYAGRRSVALLEMDLASDRIVKKWNTTGAPYASPDGRYIVTLYKSVNETSNLLLDSKVYVLFIPDNNNAAVFKSKFDIPGGVSKLVFDKKTGQQGGYLAYISLVYSDKIAVIDLDLLESYAAKISYIEGVGNVYSAPGSHSVHRPLLGSGSWLLSPATANNSVAIINIAKRELHGMVGDVIGGSGLVAVHSSLPSPNGAADKICCSQETLIVILLFSFYKAIA